jgi:hypothetical protein
LARTIASNAVIGESWRDRLSAVGYWLHGVTGDG